MDALLPDEIWIVVLQVIIAGRNELHNKLYINKRFLRLATLSVRVLTTRHKLTCNIISSMPNVSGLQVMQPGQFSDLRHISTLVNIRHLTLKSVTMLFNLDKMPLKSLSLDECFVDDIPLTVNHLVLIKHKQKLDLWQHTDLQYLRLHNCAPVVGYEHAKQIHVDKTRTISLACSNTLVLCMNNTHYPWEFPQSLTRLDLVRCKTVAPLPANLLQVRVVSAGRHVQIPDKVTALDISDTTIGSLPLGLKLLMIQGKPKHNITMLTNLTSLHMPDYCLESWGSLTNLRRLTIGAAASESLTTLTNLRSLTLLPNAGIPYVLCRLTTLHKLVIKSDIFSLYPFESIDSVLALTQLLDLTLPSCTNADFTALIYLQQAHFGHIRGTIKLPKSILKVTSQYAGVAVSRKLDRTGDCVTIAM